jgi:hypothetical protein
LSTLENSQSPERVRHHDVQPVGRPLVDSTNHHEWANFSTNQQAKLKTDTVAYVKQGILPDTHLDLFGGSPATGRPDATSGRPDATAGRPDVKHDKPDATTGKLEDFFGPGPANDSSTASRKPEDILSDPKATAQQKLQTAEQLVASGKDHVTVTDKDGTKRDLRLEVEHQGNKNLVHMYAEEGGKERVVMRGVDDGHGNFTHEKNANGSDASFNGSWWSQHMADKTSLTGTGDTPDGGRQQGQGGRQRPHDVPSPQPPDRRTDGSDTPSPNPSPDAGTMDRSQFSAQLQDPRVMAAFAGRMASEVGSQGPAAQLAFAEEVMNRAASRNQTLMQALSGSYYPTSHPGSSHNPAYISAITTAWQQGTDTIHGATGNASGHVGFGVPGGHYDSSHHWVSPNQTANIGGERFGYEQVDLSRGWMAKYAQLKSRGSIASHAGQD